MRQCLLDPRYRRLLARVRRLERSLTALVQEKERTEKQAQRAREDVRLRDVVASLRAWRP